MSGNPTPPSNVVAMPTNWPGPMFPPGGRPWPQSPSCFSELAGLNACYDSVQMMEQILAKVMTDLVTNDKAVQAAIVAAIAASGSNVPLIGVTNGSDAQPGQVGEWVSWIVNATYPAQVTNSQVVTIGTLQPGDWDLYGAFISSGYVAGVQCYLNPQPPEVTYPGLNVYLGVTDAQAIDGGTFPFSSCRALTAAPILLAFTLVTNVLGGTSATSNNGNIVVNARRRR